MADIKPSLPKAVRSKVGKCRRRRGRKKKVTMAPASINGPIAELEKEIEREDIDWCKECMKRDEWNAVSYMQISDELAVLVCNDEQCTSLPTLAPGSHLVVERRAADIIQCRKRKRRATSLQKFDAPNPPNKHNLSQPQAPLSATVSPLAHRGIVQWQNENSMCWLDVCMLLLVQFRSLRQCHQALGATSPLRTLCDGFDSAQDMARTVIEAAEQNLCEQPNSNNSTSVEQPTDTSDVELLSAYLESDLHRAGENDKLVRSELSDNFLYFIEGKLPNGNMCAQYSTDKLLDPLLSDRATLSPDGIAFKQTSRLRDTSTGKLATSLRLLRTLRNKLFEILKPKLGCIENKEESPISALPTLLRLDGVTEEHFTLRYRKEFYCFSCGFTNVTVHRNVIASVTSTAKDFSMQNLTMYHPCPQCKAPNQSSRLIYHSLPTCPLIHFSNGLSNSTELPWLQPNFRHNGQQYHLSCIIQYIRHPNHFVIWIRDPSRELWIKCDGLSSPVCLWESPELSIPPSEIHLVGWERQNSECYSCVDLQQQMISIQEAALEMDDDHMFENTHDTESTSCNAPLRKRSCPAAIGQSASLLAMSNSTSSVEQVARRKSDYSYLVHKRSEPLPPSSILSIGTPPQSPEFQLPQASSSQESKDSISSAALKTGRPGGQVSKQQTLSLRDQLNNEKWERAAASPKSDDHGHTSNRRSVASYLQSKAKYQKKPPEKVPGVLTGLLGNFTKSITRQRQDSVKESSKPRAIYTPVTNNFSVLQTLHSLNINSSIPKKDIKSEDLEGKPDKKPGSTTQLVTEKGSVLPSVLKRVQKLRIPRQKFNSFSAFKERSASKFSGYLKQKEPAADDVHSNCNTEGHEGNVSQIQEDDFQSSILLTPSSSVSSPSACSDVSLQNENLPGGPSDNPETGSPNNPMNALCQALDVVSCDVTQAVAPQVTSEDDDCFLRDLLR
ncbi:uncharacterized protein LOC121419076 isoform X1 [Lytechinus variegatus]|uniref:uncharacterized protein LOC121419076 isoform X1 n=2 Tax=Lytechinus variegatus TaxID=7654 RepID=UPI001BB2AE5D|nr:uncharacterized protein LOC121419076 isoform X1 [Lytechinus variegatus]